MDFVGLSKTISHALRHEPQLYGGGFAGVSLGFRFSAVLNVGSAAGGAT